MKKLFSVMLCFLMLAAMQIPAFATNGFVKSPTANVKPEIIEGTNMEGNANRVVVHAYGERNELNATEKANIESAYNSIKGADKLTDVNTGLKDVAADKKIKEENLSVSDLFHVGYQDTNGSTVENSGSYKIKVKAATLKNFVGLMYYDGETWTNVEGAKVDENGYLEFTTDKQGAFAVVVDTTISAEIPKTGTDPFNMVLFGIALVSGIACVTLIAKKNANKKESA